MEKKIENHHRFASRISGKTRLVGLLGDPIDHSISPAMHNLAFNMLELDYCYLAFKTNVDNLKSMVDSLKTLNVLGFNVTMPIKQEIIPYLDELSLEAQILGSVNTVKNEEGKLIGYNTDGQGYVMDLRKKGVLIKGQRFLILGAGGAATAIAVELARAGAGKITILNRKVTKAEKITSLVTKIANECQARPLKLEEGIIAEELKESDVVINCTPLGMGTHEGESVIKDFSVLNKELIISDIIYVPKKTSLLKMGEKKGCKTINGVGMIIGQGALAFKIWTGRNMPVEEIESRLF